MHPTSAVQGMTLPSTCDGVSTLSPSTIQRSICACRECMSMASFSEATDMASLMECHRALHEDIGELIMQGLYRLHCAIVSEATLMASNGQWHETVSLLP